jgi:hypothetical protein
LAVRYTAIVTSIPKDITASKCANRR